MDAAAVIFEKDTVMTCGSERMAHMAAHPQLADLLSCELLCGLPGEQVYGALLVCLVHSVYCELSM